MYAQYLKDEDTVRLLQIAFPSFALIKTSTFKVKQGKKIFNIKFSRDFKYLAFRYEKDTSIEVVSYEDLNKRVSYDIREISN